MAKTKRKQIVAFGELLLRLTTRGHERFVQAREFDARYTGAEANVAVALAHLGIEAYVVSTVPGHEIGQSCINYLRQYGVHTEHIVRGGDRLGIVYFELGASQRATKLIYDRSHSCFQEAEPREYRWDHILKGKHWFHFSGTAPARGERVVKALKDALSVADRMGIKVSCDINFRSKLWSIEKARRVLPGLLEDVDAAVVGVKDLTELFGIRVRKLQGRERGGESEALREGMARFLERFGFSQVAMTMREEVSASWNQLGAILYDGRSFFESRRYRVDIVDRVGGGDAFSAGMIYGFLSGLGPQETIEFAVAASCLKHTIFGDFNLVSVDEVRKLMGGKELGRVQR